MLLRLPIALANNRREGEVDAKGGKYAKAAQRGTPQPIYALKGVNWNTFDNSENINVEIDHRSDGVLDRRSKSEKEARMISIGMIPTK